MKVWLKRLKTFLNTTAEWHSFVEGFCDGFFPFMHKYEPTRELKEAIESEHHYYRGGVIVGVIAVIWFWIGIYKVIA